ncbi:MAG TPA: extracellular solute-binding protein [Chloroflexota bacterium]|nr:extracellular solute-binding protein [Chloroflexota bacterium]
MSRRRLLASIAKLGVIGLASVTTAGCGPAIRLSRVADLYQQAIGQAKRATGATPPPKRLEWFTPIPDPSEILARAPSGSPTWNQAMGWQRMLDPWKASHPDITLVYHVAAASDLTKQQIAAAATGSPGDVAYTDVGSTLGKARVLDPLDVGSLARKIVSVALTPQSTNNQVYALPIFVSCLGLYLNHQRLKDAELDPNTPLRDWASFETASQKLTNRSRQLYGFDVFGSGSPMSGQARYGPFLWSAGGSFFDETGQAAVWNQPNGLNAIVYLARLSQNYAWPGAAVAPDDTLIQNWLSGRTAAIIYGPELSAQADDQHLSYSVQSIPAYVAGQASSLAVSAGAVGIFAQSSHKDWALDFIHYLADKDAQIAGLDYLRLLPANVDAGDAAPIFQRHLGMQEFLRILREDDIHPFPMAPTHDAEIREIFRVYLGIALQGLSTPEAAWNTSAAMATKLLKAPVATPTPHTSNE